MGIPRFDAGYEVLGRGKRAGEVTGVEIIDAATLLGGPSYIMHQSYVVGSGKAYSTGTLRTKFVERFEATPPGATMKYGNRSYRRLTEAEVDALNLQRLKDGGLLIR